MRLIDADELKELISSELDKHFNAWDNTITVAEMETITRDAIDNAPTIKTFTLLDIEEQYRKGLEKGLSEWETERPQGEWKEFIMPLPLSDSFKVGAICSECNTTWDCETNFCPYCGAEMKK